MCLKIVPYVRPSAATNIATGKRLNGFFFKSKLMLYSEPFRLDQKMVSLYENVRAILRKYGFVSLVCTCAFSTKLMTHAICGLDYGIVTGTA